MIMRPADVVTSLQLMVKRFVVTYYTLMVKRFVVTYYDTILIIILLCLKAINISSVYK